MINEKEIYEHLKKGGDPQALYEAFLKEMHTIQKKIDKEEEEADQKKAEEKKQEIEKAREAAITAFSNYFALILPDRKKNPKEYANFVKDAFNSLEETIAMLSGIKVVGWGPTFVNIK